MTAQDKIAQPAAATQDENYQGIRDVSKQLDVTPRTLRFYEDNDLISPQRIGSTRIYSRRDVGRIRLVLRGKRLGFSIREIKEFLDLYDSDPDHREQVEHLRKRVRQKLETLRTQKAAIEETIRELREIDDEVTGRLKQLARNPS